MKMTAEQVAEIRRREVSQPTIGRVPSLTNLQRDIVIAAIRGFGGSDHPYPSDATVGGFTVKYALSCLNKYRRKLPATVRQHGEVAAVIAQLKVVSK